MSLGQYSKEQLKEMSLIEIAYEYLKNSTQAVSFNQIVEDIAAAVELSEGEVRSRIAQFYTDLNIDGRFLAVGENRWGLRVWYPVDTVEEEVVTTTVKTKKKKSKKVVDEDELEDYDEVEEDLDYEDLDYVDDEDEDTIEDGFDDLDVEDDFEEEEDVIEDEEEYELDEDLEEDLDEGLDEELDEEEELDEDLEEDED